MKLSVVIPAYNETENLQHNLPKIATILRECPLVESFEFIIVDDHSSEPLFQTLQTLQAQQIHSFTLECIRLSRRSGSHIALRAGLAVATGDAALCIAADGQEDPAAIPEMLKKRQAGAQVVWGLRRERNGEGLLQKAFSLAFYKMLAMLTESGDSIDLSRADFYLLDRRVVDALNSLPEHNSSLFGLVAWIGYEQDSIDYDRHERVFGKSKWKFRSRMRLAKDWIIAFSGIPLKIMTVVGFWTALVGFFYTIWVFVVGLLGHPSQGWSSLMIVVLVLGGLQMAMLGIIGEYLWRTLEETRRRDLYFIEKSTLENGPVKN